MQAVPYPHSFEAGSEWEDGYAHPEGFKAKLKARFPDWTGLHDLLNQEDKCVWELLWVYQRKLGTIKAEEIIVADDNGTLKDVVARVREALELCNWLNDLEREFFPEEIARREEQNRRALESWQY